ncbi:ABC transporter permease [candidate division KSB1 bacterium]
MKRILTLGSDIRSNKLSSLSVITFFILWLILSQLDLINELILPSPLRVILSIKDVGFVLVYHITATIVRILIGFTLGVCFGILIGTLMQYFRTMFIILDGIIETFRPVPPVALVPFFILIFGFSEFGKILLVVLGTTLVMVVGTIEAIERIPVGLMRWGLISGLSRKALFLKVILPASWPEMRGSLRIAMALAITLVIVSEFMGASYGLGYLINISKVTLTTPTILLSVIILGWIGWSFDKLLRLLYSKTCKWDIRAKGAIQ